jgi:hypothetical protein
MSARACRYCGGPIPDGRRLDAFYCSDLHKGRFHRFGPAKTATHGNPGKPAAPRRPSRDGLGVHVYILPDDSAAAILGKVQAARDRKVRP